MTSAWPKNVRFYPCRVPGCDRPSTHYAVGNVARYGHVCRECWMSFTPQEQGLYEDEAAKKQARGTP